MPNLVPIYRLEDRNPKRMEGGGIEVNGKQKKLPVKYKKEGGK